MYEMKLGGDNIHLEHMVSKIFMVVYDLIFGLYIYMMKLG